MRLCEVPGCSRPYLAKGMCKLHYYRVYTGCKIVKPPVCRDDIIKATIDCRNYVKCPVYNKMHEIIDYCILDKDIWGKKFKGILMNKSNYGYARARKTFVHYEIIGKPKDRWTFIDHINRDRLDNRRNNLRFVTPTENFYNCKNYGGGYGASGMQGIVFVKGRPNNCSPWRVVLPEGFTTKEGHKMKYFSTLEEAKKFRAQFPFWGSQASFL